MCYINQFKYQNYSRLDFNIKNDFNTEIFKSFKSKLDKGEISLNDLRKEPIPYWLYNELYSYIMGKVLFKNNITTKTINSTTNNLHNYSIAKTFKFIDTINKVLREFGDEGESKNEIVSVADTFFNAQQNTEDYQTEKITKTASEIADGNLLEYVSRKDGRVRDEHKRADGVILPASDKWWSVGQNLLSDWNCRCSIIKSSSDQPNITHSQASIKTTTTKPNSTIDLKSEKVIVFNQHLDLFDVPTSVKRKYFRKNGF